MKYLDFTFFESFKCVCDIVSIKPSTEVGHPYAIDLRQLRYNTDATIDFNLTYEDDKWEKLPYKLNLRPPQLYNSEIPISYMKWSHLQGLKAAISKECHHFYDNLLHLPNPKVTQKTKETDISSNKIFIFVKTEKECAFLIYSSLCFTGSGEQGCVCAEYSNTGFLQH